MKALRVILCAGLVVLCLILLGTCAPKKYVPKATQTNDFLLLVQTGTPQDVKAAIAKGADLNARDAGGFTPLITAAAHNKDPEVVTVLLEAGADAEARDSAHGGTPLLWAATFNPNPDVIAALLKAGADINAQNTLEGRTALISAAEVGPNPAGVIMVLLKAGEDAKVKDKFGKTALYYAKYNSNLMGTDALKQLEEA